MNDISKILETLAAEDNLRTLRSADGSGRYISYGGRRYVNMSSNDYLGLGGEAGLQRRFLERAAADGRFVMSNSASRLITGNSADYEALEAAVAVLYGGKSALVLGSGYLANSGVLPALVGKDDLVLADRLVHASLIDGLRLCGCKWLRFRHNDVQHLEELLGRERAAHRNVWVVTESVFSMDGDRAPLAELVALKHRYDLRIYLDEAHAFGVCGVNGAGGAAAEGLDGEMDVIMATFGKALASTGAFVAVSPLVRELLVNRLRTLIFSTALPPLNLQWTRMMVEMMPEFEPRREKLRRLVAIISPDDPQATHIVPIAAPGNREVVALAERLRGEGFWVTPIRKPTVPEGSERIRISLSAALEEEDVRRFVELKNIPY